MTKTKESVPGYRANIITQPMHMIDHTCAKLDGPPPMPAVQETPKPSRTRTEN